MSRFFQRTYRTTYGLAHTAILRGSLVASALLMACLLGVGLFDAILNGELTIAWRDFPLIIFMSVAYYFLFVFIFYLGMMVLAGPIWALLHRLGVRDRVAAGALGAVLTGGVNALWFPWQFWLGMGAIGGIVGLVVWYAAYGWNLHAEVGDVPRGASGQVRGRGE